MKYSAVLTFPVLGLLMSVQTVRADAVSESFEQAMRECVSISASRIGSPLADTNKWANVVAGFTVVGYSMVKLFGIEGHSSIEEAIKARTVDVLFAALEQNGSKGFRGQALETLDSCVPSALVAAAFEMERQKKSVCSDDTGYREHVSILTSNEGELRAIYGNSAGEIQSSALKMIGLEIKLAFPEIFWYGKEDKLEFSEVEYEGLHTVLRRLDSRDFIANRPHVDEALASIRKIDGEHPERIKTIQRELTCIKDWLDIYPAEEIKRLKEKY